jgi:nitrogen fixation/metabolism regulation signal transduction histidine kinase
MGFSNFRINVVLRALILLALCWVVVWSALAGDWLVTPLVSGALLLLCVIELVRYVEKTTTEFRMFVDFVAHHDYSTPVSLPFKGRVFSQLQEAYRLLAEELRRLNLQKIANLQYLEAVVNHGSVALCCFDDAGLVTLANESAKRLFGLPYLNSRQTFARIDERLPGILEALGNGERTLLGIRRDDDLLQLLLYATEFTLADKHYKLVTFQNIRGELDRQELDSWQKLIRVLTHEIMNSITPIVSLSRLVRESLVDETCTPPAFRTPQPQDRDDALRAIAAIHTRSSGLLDFVRAYRTFAAVPQPMFSHIEVRTLLEGVRTLLSQELQSSGVSFLVECRDEPLGFYADARQIEQVLINLTRNAMDAVEQRHDGRILIAGSRTLEQEVLLQVIDNGTGIPAEHLDNIFVPFFTTKRHGTGVGLSFSRQLVQMNHGLLSVRSQLGSGSTFSLRFPETIRDADPTASSDGGQSLTGVN